MARERTDPGRRIKDILRHVGPMPAEAAAPLLHYDRAVKDLWGMLEYVERKIGREGLRPATLLRHMTQIYRLLLLQSVEALERFLKELAAVCVDHLAGIVLDKR